MYNQLSGDVFVALATLTAISGLINALQLINADRVFRATPKRFAASVTVKSSDLIISSRKISPGWVELWGRPLKYWFAEKSSHDTPMICHTARPHRTLIHHQKK